MSAAVIPSMADLWNGATLPDLLCDPCTSGQHPVGGCDARIPALATDGEATAMACACEPCHDEFNDAFWARVRREGATVMVPETHRNRPRSAEQGRAGGRVHRDPARPGECHQCDSEEM